MNSKPALGSSGPTSSVGTRAAASCWRPRPGWPWFRGVEKTGFIGFRILEIGIIWDYNGKILFSFHIFQKKWF
jgi:hypothetical protein